MANWKATIAAGLVAVAVLGFVYSARGGETPDPKKGKTMKTLIAALVAIAVLVPSLALLVASTTS